MTSYRLFLAIFILCNSSFIFAKEEFKVGAVASGHPLATKAGLEILEKGGNAFDAAIAIASTLNVVEPAMSGVGGYGTILMYDARKKEILYLNGSGKFPAKTNTDFMRPPTINYQKNMVGAKSIGVPGNLNAWQAMHKKYGKTPWNNLFQNAINHAERGFPISPYIAVLIGSDFHQFSDYTKSFYGKDGHPLKEGDILVQKDLGKTYRLIASRGVEPFYKGEIALLIDKKMKEVGSFLTIEDLRADIAEWWAPVKITQKGYDIYTAGIPGNGFTSLFTIGVMNQFPLQNLQHNSPQYLHTLIEVLKESSKARLNYPGNLEEKSNIVDHVLTSDNFRSVAKTIKDDKISNFNVRAGTEGANTTHFVVIDKWGNIVSSTQTLGFGFGSKVMVEGTGIWMNDSIAFSKFEPKGNPMDALPGRYKLSSNSPIIIMKDGLPWAALGTPGGHTIPQNVAQIVINLIDFNMNMQQAIDSPKLAFIDEKHIVCTESGIPQSVVSSLEKMGHTIDNKHIKNYIGLSGKIGNAMGIKIIYDHNKTSFDVGIDKRKDGWSTTHLIHNEAENPLNYTN